MSQDLEEALRKANETIVRQAAEIKRLHLDYGVVAHPERVWQGKCGHLWYRKGGSDTCPHCREHGRLASRIVELEKQLQESRKACTMYCDEIASLAPEVQRLRTVVKHQDAVLKYRADVIAGRVTEQPEPKEWR